MREMIGEDPAMWGRSIIGFDARHLVYDSGRELNYLEIGVSPRKAATPLYLADALGDSADLLERLGPHTTGKGCLYLKRLSDVDLGVRRELAARSLASARSGPP